MTTTIVSAFVANVNSRRDRTLEKYIEYGKQLLETKAPKIIFIDECVFETFADCINEYTHLISIKKEDSYLYQYMSLITDYNLSTTCPEKDTLDYIFTMCYKTEWIKEAILLNYFKTEQFVWIDFGIAHVCVDLSKDQFNDAIVRVSNQSYDKIRIASIWNMHYKLNVNLYNTVVWYFAGGVFGGKMEALMIFANEMKKMCIELITVKKTIMWEVNIWVLIYNLMPDMFHGYSCNHNSTILLNY